MTFDKFTIKAQEAIQSALDTAKRNGQQTIEPVHILAGVMDKGKDVTDYVLQKLGVNAQTVELSLQNEIKHLPKVSGGEPYFSPDSNKVLEKTLDISQKLGDDYVSIEPLLLALLQVGSTASRILKDAGCTEKEMLQAIQSLRQGQKVESQSGDENFQALSKYATNLVERARAGKLDPVIGRDEEIRRVLQILSRRTKNNPILIGEPGTGKTAIIEGLAERIVRGDVPVLQNQPNNRRSLNREPVREVSDEWLGRKNGIAGYNRMMLSAGFYELFRDYEYLLICHTDAWIFRDELADWCRRGYDCVAAPWVRRKVYDLPILKQYLRC